MRSFFILIFLLGLLSNSIARAGKIEKGFEALKEYNYFKAKELFESSLKKSNSAASYGLALIFYRKDNPFHSLDSAFLYIQKAEENYSSIKEKKKEKYKEFGFDYLNILELRSKISTEFFEISLKSNTVDAYTQFINAHPWANELFVATHKRDSIAYEEVKLKNTSAAYQLFLKTYPSSSLFATVQLDYYRTQYKEFTHTNSLVSYLEFMAKCPDNPYVPEAEDRVYELTTENNSVESFYSFIQAYPKNKNVGNAWRNLYQLYMVNYTDERIQEFIEEYPKYPYKEELEADIQNMKLNLLPYKEEEYFGFMDYSGKIIIPAEFEQVGFFKEGLALAVKNGQSGYLDKSGKVVIPFQYSSGSDFEQGRAIVEKNGRFGMIDRVGNLIFPLEFNDLGFLSEGLVYGMKDSLYGYYDKNFSVRLPEKYTEAFAFIDGKAKVQIGENQAFIDEYGTFTVPPGYPEISFFNDTLLTFEEEELFGLMRKNCQVVVPAVYEEIGQLSIDRALVVRDGLLGYIDGSGKEIVKPQFEVFPNYLERGQFHSNLAIVKQKGKFGIIDKQGKVVLPISYSEIGNISALISFTKGKAWGFMDLTGKVIIQPEFDYAESFKDGLAVVEKLTLQGVIDSKRKEIIPLNFTSIDRLTKDMFLVSNGSKYGVYSTKGEQLVPLNYQQIRLIEKDFLLLTSHNEVHYLYLPEKRIIQPIKAGE